MSIKWKWLMATFCVQLFMGVLFSAIQFHQQTQVALDRLASDFQLIQHEVNSRAAQMSVHSHVELQRLARDLFMQKAPRYLVVEHRGQVLVRMGEPGPSATPNDVRLAPLYHHNQGVYYNTYNLGRTGGTLTIGFSESDWFRERNQGVLFVAQVLLFSAFASSLMLWVLSQAMTARLYTLRDKAMALQAGQVGVRMDVTGRDEITVLGRAFNEMANAIDQHIANLKAFSARVEAERNRLDSLLSSISTGIAYLNEEYDILYVNKAFGKLLGTTWPEPQTSDVATLLVNAGLVSAQSAVVHDLIREHFHRRQLPVELDFENGSTLQFRFQLQNNEVLGVHGIVVVEDVSLRKNVQDLRQAVERDPLTQALNRRGFDYTLNNRLNRALHGETVGLLFLDLDGFKQVNDTLGHKAGDQVLRSAAHVLNSACRTVDVVARLGGDEFAIIVAKASDSLLHNMAERIIRAFEREPLFKRILQNHGLRVSCSIGGAICPQHGNTAQALLDAADAQMYDAKRAGKNCFRLPEPEPSVTALVCALPVAQAEPR